MKRFIPEMQKSNGSSATPSAVLSLCVCARCGAIAARVRRCHLRAALVIADVHTRRLYAEKGLPQQVFVNTMRDISVWVHDAAWAYRVTGLCNVPWIAHILFLEIFWIGRLEFEFSKTNFAAARLPLAARRRVPIPDKTAVLNVHIPADGKLLPKAVEDAFRRRSASLRRTFRNISMRFCVR